MLKMNNISKTFHANTVNENCVFKDFNLTINESEFVTVIGSNGAGKSTLFNLMSSTLKVDQGTIEIANKNITNQPEYITAQSIARVYQNPNLNVALEMTVLENISMALHKGNLFNFRRCVKRSTIEKIKGDLVQLGLQLENSLNTKVKYLSGGQRQALCMYMVTLGKPQLLLLDEHTAALDPKSSEFVLNLTNKLVSQKQLTTVMITHNLKNAIETGNRLIMLHKGQVVIDISGKEKQELTIEKLLALFESVKGDISDEALFN